MKKYIDDIHSTWKPIISSELNQQLLLDLNYDILPNIIYYPNEKDIFRVFTQNIKNIKVIILGLEPYPLLNYNNGLAYGINLNLEMTKSLKIIKKEIENEGFIIEKDVNEWKSLEHLEKQGVLLLNMSLTVESGKPHSHAKYWEYFTKRLIWYISSFYPCIWLLWGSKAQKMTLNMSKSKIFKVSGYSNETINEIPINQEWNYILSSSYPNPKSQDINNSDFYGCNHFIYCNKILKLLNKKEIIW